MLIGTWTLSHGVASLSLSALALLTGVYLIFAVYSGDTTHQFSTSSTVSQTIS
jgi:hypothetical protein